MSCHCFNFLSKWEPRSAYGCHERYGAFRLEAMNLASQNRPKVWSMSTVGTCCRAFPRRPRRHLRREICGTKDEQCYRLSDLKSSRASVLRSSTYATTAAYVNSEVETRDEHFERLERFYDDNDFLFDEEDWNLEVQEVSFLSEDYMSSLMSAGQVQPGSRVLIWGGSLALVQQLSCYSSDSLVLSHCSLPLLATAKELMDEIVCWHGDIVEIPSSYGPFDCVFLNSLPALSKSPARLLQAVAGLCKPGSRVVINHSQGRKNFWECREENSGIIVHDLPDSAVLENMIARLPFKIVDFQDQSSYFLAALEVTSEALSPGLGADDVASVNGSKLRDNRTFDLVPNYPLIVNGHVVQGFGRGSKLMAIPTANIDPKEVPEEVLQLTKGVYCGWAQVSGGGLDGGVHKMVMNIGNRPTFADGGGISVEVHVFHDYGRDFYGMEMNLAVLGFVRDEMQFKSVVDLVQRIHIDSDIAKKGLDDEDMQKFAAHEIFTNR